MIIVPAWVKEDLPEGLFAVLGSSPGADAESDWIPRECISKCIYAEEQNESTNRLAMIVMRNNDQLPEKIKKILERK